MDGATVTLRNSATGAAERTTTGRDGSYRFKRLAPGEYTVEAERAGWGHGSVDGVFVAAGHDSRVQTALAADSGIETAASISDRGVQPATSGPGSVDIRAGTDSAEAVSRAEVAEAVLAKLVRPPAEIPETDEPAADVRLPTIRLDALAVREQPYKAAPVVSGAKANGEERADEVSLETSAVIQPEAGSTAALEGSAAASSLASAQGALMARFVAQAAEMALMTARHGLTVEEVGTATAGIQTTLTGEQLEGLPLARRNWENFILDSAAGQGAGEETERSSGGRSVLADTESVDGAHVRLAFAGGNSATDGSRESRAGTLLGPGGNEAAIREVTVAEGIGTGRQGDEGEQVETRRGGNGWHGQAFLFDRQNLWGARNPFSQWVKETTLGTGTTVPAFTPIPYSPGDIEMRWGLGAGGGHARKGLSWYAALDGAERNNPAVSTVKHPENFFAQPSNDEMQVLSARLDLSSANPVLGGAKAYSEMLTTLGGLLGPSPRSSERITGFGRLDWKTGERNEFMLEGTGAESKSAGGGLRRVEETYGTHSMGGTRVSETWVQARWRAFLTPNLLAITQGSMGRQIRRMPAETPSGFEQTLLASAWRQLPQMTVDSRYGFTIGNPARFGPGSSPDEHLYEAQESLDWVRGRWLMQAGFELQHNADATSFLRNQTGTYHYAHLENFASDALVFAKYGLADALDPMHQHNCDQREKAWRDTTGQLHGLGYLPCYSYYTQTLGPTEWHLSTNDWAGFVTTQWQPAKRLVMSVALRWNHQELPPPIALVNNPELPLTQKMPALGHEWSPRLSVAWGIRESRWPVLRLGYGLYGGRTSNAVVENALTQTGSLKGDLSFFMRPTDNLPGEGGGAPPFPYVLGGMPGNVVKPGVAEFAPGFRDPEIQQGVAELEERLPGRILVSASAQVSLGRRLPVIEDTNYDPAANPKTITYAVKDATGKGPLKTPQITVPFFASWPLTGSGRLNTNYQQIAELMSRANSTYEAAVVRVSRYAGKGLSFHTRYTYSHAMDWNPDESTQALGSSVLDPTDFEAEYGTSNLDVRHSATAMAVWHAPWRLKGLGGWLADGWILSGTGQFHSGLPYTMRTSGSIPRLFQTTGSTIVGLGPGMNGYGGDQRVYGVGRNTYRYPHTWKADVRLGRRFGLGHERELELLAESFNLFNHQNVTEVETTGYTIEPGSVSGSLPTLNFLTGLKLGQTDFGLPLNVNAVDWYRERQFDFGLRLRF